MAEIITTITTAGYQAAVNNAPDKDGFRIKIQYADIYVGSAKKGRFEVKGAKVGDDQIRIRATITSESEEYSYDSVRLIETLGGKDIHFATVKRKDSGVLDFVSPSKKSTFSFNLKFSTISADKITIIQDDGNNLALAELDTHKQAADAHAELFSALKGSTTTELNKKTDKTITITAGNGLTGGGNLSANRTLTLGTPSNITASSTNSVTSTSHTHAISKASTGQAGIVALYNGLNADYTDRALTAAQGKALNDKITEATAATTALSSSTDTALATKANTSTTITAGNGLTGGGNLSANRTFTLGTPSSINANSTNSVTADSHTHAISKASTGQAGIVQLYDGLTGEYTDRALTAAQGKALNDKFTNIPQVSGLDLDTTAQTMFFRNATNGYPTAENGGHAVGGEHSGFMVGWNGECMQFVNGGDRLFIRGNDLSIDQNAWAEWGLVLTHKIGLRKTDVAIATGTINNGETIPLPKGFTQEQCKWFVSMSDSNPQETKWDSNEVDPRMHYRITCIADSNRVVTSKMHVFDDNGDKVKTYPATASYIIIGKK